MSDEIKTDTTTCPRCNQPVKYQYIEYCGILQSNDYVLIADQIFHSKCWDDLVKENPQTEFIRRAKLYCNEIRRNGFSEAKSTALLNYMIEAYDKMKTEDRARAYPQPNQEPKR